MARDTLVISRRFQGPPDSGNGGYVCGRLASFVDGQAVVRLQAPPPLETELAVRRVEDRVELANGDAVVATARRGEVSVAAPDPPSPDEAERASRRFSGFQDHVFPACFVCGTERTAKDGLRIFPGPLEDRALVASPWIPDSTLLGGDGRVAPEFLWAALDCPGGFAFAVPPSGGMLLGELAVALSGSLEVDEPCVVVGWEIEHHGRKHLTGSALYGANGECRGLGLGTWIEIARR